MSKLSSIIGLRELRENTDKYIEATKKGRSFTVVRRSRPIFKLVPVDEWGDEGNWKTLLDLTKGKYKNMTASDLLEEFRKIDDKQA